MNEANIILFYVSIHAGQVCACVDLHSYFNFNFCLKLINPAC